MTLLIINKTKEITLDKDPIVLDYWELGDFDVYWVLGDIEFN